MFQIFWLAVRILAALVGAFLGSLLTGWVVRLTARLVWRRPAPWLVVVVARLAGAVAAGLLIYYFLYPGGSGGWGLGGGGWGLGGGGTGKVSTGTGTGTPGTTAPEKQRPSMAATLAAAVDTLTIEMLGGSRYKGEERFYLIQGKPPARTLQEIRDLLQKNPQRYRKLEILIYPDSVAVEHPATSRLEDLARQLGLSLSITRISRQ
jgi:hypothetical protein